MLENPKSLNNNGRLKFLLKDSIIYGGATVTRTLFSLLTFPIIARYFSVEDYGLIDAISVLGSLLTISIVFGQDSAIARYFYELEDIHERKTLISQSLSIQFLVAFLSIPLLLIFTETITKYYLNRDGLQELTMIIIWQIPFALLINFSSNLLKWTFKRLPFLFIQLGSSFSQVIVIIIAIYFFKINIKSVFQITLYVNIIFSVIGIFYVRKWITKKYSINYYRRLLQYGVPFGIMGLIYAFLPTMDRFFINRFLKPIDLGLYAVAFKIAMLIQIPILAFQTAWGPFFLSLYKEKNASQTFNTVFFIFTLIISTIGLAIILFSKTIIIILASEKYIDSTQVIFPLVMGLIIMSLSWILSIGIDLSKKSYLKIYSTSLRLIATGLSTFYLIQQIGLIGIGFGFLIGHLSSLILEVFLSYRAYPLRFNLSNTFFVLMYVFLFGGIAIFFQVANLILQNLIYFGLLIIFVLLMWIGPLKKQNILKIILNFRQ